MNQNITDNMTEKKPVRYPRKGYFFAKRCFDIFSSFLVIVVISWLLIILFLIQIVCTRGHPIFVDSRIGKGGKPIKVYKFRSMYYDAESNIDKYLSPEQKEIWLRERKLDNDPRITPFGRILRKSSFDELPQLFNILFGSMSVVGPRAVTQTEIEVFYSEEERSILLSARPGLTGYWQVYGRSNCDYGIGNRAQMELEYFKHWSFFYDLKIIFLTIPAVLTGNGAQ